MKILLVIPRYNFTDKANYAYVFPLGLGYISSSIKKAGYDVDCLNLNHLNGKVEDLVRKALDEKYYDFICAGHTGLGYVVVEKIVNAAKKHSTKPRIILGGPLISSEPELMLETLKPDFIVIGEGEITIVELLKCLKGEDNLKKVNGIGFIDDSGKKIFTNPRKPIDNLDSLPIPDFEGFGYEEQLKNGSVDTIYNAFDYPMIYPILGSRSCPFQCTFCYHSIEGRYRTRNIDNIINEIKDAIKKYKVNVIFLYDDLFASSKERLKDFCNKMEKIIKETPWEVKWSCSLWVSTVDKEILEMVKGAGCFLVGLGFESYSQKVLKSMKKPITPEQINNAIKLCMELKMPIAGNFIFGDVAETKETAKETLDYWKENCKGQVQLGFIQPYPGSEIYNQCIKKGIIKDKLDFIKNKIAHTNWFNMTENMSNKEVNHLKKDILEARKKYCKYIIPSKIKKMKKNRYELTVRCPFCNEIINYKNVLIHNNFHYSVGTYCRNCKMRFYIVSPMYKFGVDYYKQLDFLRRNYLLARDKLLKKRT